MLQNTTPSNDHLILRITAAQTLHGRAKKYAGSYVELRGYTLGTDAAGMPIYKLATGCLAQRCSRRLLEQDAAGIVAQNPTWRFEPWYGSLHNQRPEVRQ